HSLIGQIDLNDTGEKRGGVSGFGCPILVNCSMLVDDTTSGPVLFDGTLDDTSALTAEWAGGNAGYCDIPGLDENKNGLVNECCEDATQVFCEVHDGSYFLDYANDFGLPFFVETDYSTGARRTGWEHDPDGFIEGPLARPSPYSWVGNDVDYLFGSCCGDDYFEFFGSSTYNVLTFPAGCFFGSPVLNDSVFGLVNDSFGAAWGWFSQKRVLDNDWEFDNLPGYIEFADGALVRSKDFSMSFKYDADRFGGVRFVKPIHFVNSSYSGRTFDVEVWVRAELPDDVDRDTGNVVELCIADNNVPDTSLLPIADLDVFPCRSGYRVSKPISELYEKGWVKLLLPDVAINFGETAASIDPVVRIGVNISSTGAYDLSPIRVAFDDFLFKVHDGDKVLMSGGEFFTCTGDVFGNYDPDVWPFSQNVSDPYGVFSTTSLYTSTSPHLSVCGAKGSYFCDSLGAWSDQAPNPDSGRELAGNRTVLSGVPDNYIYIPSDLPPSYNEVPGDGILALDEAFLGTDPTKRDSDGDTWSDGPEHTSFLLDPTYGDPLDPLVHPPDSDSDGIDDNWEIFYFRDITTIDGTSNSDTDPSGSVPDKTEYARNADPTDGSSFDFNHAMLRPSGFTLDWSFTGQHNASGFETFIDENCCPADMCWDGWQCQDSKLHSTRADFFLFEESGYLANNNYRAYFELGKPPFVNVSDEGIGLACYFNKTLDVANWTVVYNVTSLKGAYQGGSGFCPASMCLILNDEVYEGVTEESLEFRLGKAYGVPADNTEWSGVCVDDSFWFEDNICDNGTWVSRTSRLAKDLLVFVNETIADGSIVSEYELFCDDVNVSAPLVEYGREDDYFIGKVPGANCLQQSGNPGDELGAGVSCANSLCVLRMVKDGTEQVFGATSLNVPVNIVGNSLVSFLEGLEYFAVMDSQ
ncbi:hypothetical protein ACFL0W_06750, partial [Nanoarchaeota archaeon]